MAVQPHSPKLPPRLETWAGEPDQYIEIDQALVDGLDFTGTTRLSIDTSEVTKVILTGAVYDTFEFMDVVCTKLEAAAVRAYKANLLRVGMADCRFTGSDFAEAYFEDCTFRNVKFDDVGFRFASFKRVRFEDCMLRQADFSNAKCTHVTFVGCDFENTNFVSAKCSDVDVTSQDLSTAKGILGLKGATISVQQLIQIAPLLASELGFRVEDVL